MKLQFVMLIMFILVGKVFCQEYILDLDYITSSCQEYNIKMQPKFKEEFLELFPKKFDDVKTYIQDTNSLKFNSDSISFKAIPRYVVVNRMINRKSVKFLELDTTLPPERIFVFNNNSLFGEIKPRTIDIYYIHHEPKGEFFWVYDCLSKQEFLFFICTKYLIYTIKEKKLVHAFNYCGNSLKLMPQKDEKKLLDEIFDNNPVIYRDCALDSPFDWTN